MLNLSKFGDELRYYCLAIGLGIFIGGAPLVWEGTGDPFDKLASYLIWLIGLSLSAMFISSAQPYRIWRWAIAVGLGFPIAVILDIINKPDAYQLPPLTVVFSLIVGMSSAFTGAYLGREIRSKNKK